MYVFHAVLITSQVLSYFTYKPTHETDYDLIFTHEETNSDLDTFLQMKKPKFIKV